MITLQRLNMDSSWRITMSGVSFLVDPWLVGSEVDGYRWLNEQWHVTQPVAIDDIGEYEFILITQSYDDHLHPQTLELLDSAKPLLATAKAYKRLQRKFPKREIHKIGEDGSGLEFGELVFKSYRPKKVLDPVYFAVSMHDPAGNSIFYAPHGFTLSEKQLGKLVTDSVDLLITTFTDFKLPAILGGHVNPGTAHAEALALQIRPKQVIHTHDEPKEMKGLVAKYAKVEYPDYDQLSREFAFRFIDIQDYTPVTI